MRPCKHDANLNLKPSMASHGSQSLNRPLQPLPTYALRIPTFEAPSLWACLTPLFIPLFLRHSCSYCCMPGGLPDPLISYRCPTFPQSLSIMVGNSHRRCSPSCLCFDWLARIQKVLCSLGVPWPFPTARPVSADGCLEWQMAQAIPQMGAH